MSDALLEWVVKGTLYLLGLASAATWAVVAIKGGQFWRAGRRDRAFFASLAGRKAPGTLPTVAEVAKYEGPAARLTEVGVRALEEAAEIGGDRAGDPAGVRVERREYVERALHEQVNRQRRASETGLVILATIATTTPFVGLFGTVWGIVHALRRIGASGSASLEVVAAPIGEALVATGIGIAVAVPAVLAYNVLVRKLKVQQGELETQASTLLKLALRARGSSAPVERAVSFTAAAL
jgi:biopolymer transport protein ExbB